MRADATFIIAEAGVNHNGSLDRALQMVDAAARAGADAVKFQTFRADQLVIGSARKAAYQIQNTGADGNQLDMLRSLEISSSDFRALSERCRNRKIGFMSTAFDLESLRLVAGMDMAAVKIASGDITAGPLVLEAARLGKPVILSTGMSSLADIEAALGILAFGLLENDLPPSRTAFESAYASAAGRSALEKNVALLHCVTEYPAPLEEVNLRAMETMRQAFGLRVGYSDHTLGTSVALGAVALGATVIEKHFTLDRTLPGPDHRASLEPGEFESLVRGIRDVETSLGTPLKRPSASELRNRAVARRSLVTTRAIAAGEHFDASNLSFKRPGDGVPASMYWDYIGRPALRNYAADEVIDP